MRYLLLALLLVLEPVAAGTEIYAQGSARFASDPVPVMDWVNGWGSDYHRGSFAYADLQQSVGFRYAGWQISYGSRRFLDASFSADTAEFYYRLEYGYDMGRTYDIDLDVAAFSGQGIGLAYVFALSSGLTIQPELRSYVVSDYQFGRFSGDSDGDQALLVVDYYFSEDKILDYPTDGSGGPEWSADVEDGSFTTLNLHLAWSNDLLQVNIGGEDLLNRVSLPVAARTRGCVLFQREANSSCPQGGGYSSETDYRGRIRSTLSADVMHSASGVQVSAFRHGHYQRFGLGKRFAIRAGVLSAAIYSSGQAGFGWQSNYFFLDLTADDYRKASMRYLDMNLGLRWRW